jgi:hypothetical protein
MTSATDSPRTRKLGWKPLTSTIRPNSAATISSRARISTLPNDANRKGEINNSATYGPSGIGSTRLVYRVDILGTDVHSPETSQRVAEIIAQTSVSPLSDSTMKELRAALADQLKQPDGPTSALADVLKRVGKEAHQKNVPPEELIVIFKELWNSLAESLRPQNPDQYESVRQRLVTLCIQAYYAE